MVGFEPGSHRLEGRQDTTTQTCDLQVAVSKTPKWTTYKYRVTLWYSLLNKRNYIKNCYPALTPQRLLVLIYKTTLRSIKFNSILYSSCPAWKSLSRFAHLNTVIENGRWTVAIKTTTRDNGDISGSEKLGSKKVCKHKSGFSQCSTKLKHAVKLIRGRCLNISKQLAPEDDQSILIETSSWKQRLFEEPPQLV